MKRFAPILCCIVFLTRGFLTRAPAEDRTISGTQWSSERAWAWYGHVPWICGFNYVPSTAVNTTEFWQADTFDPPTIDRELKWAADTGFNATRVFLQYLVWQQDPEGLKNRIDQFLATARKHGLSVTLCLFDDCAFANKEPFLGKQDAPVPGVHNSAWTPSPGLKRVTDRNTWPDLQRYVHDIVGSFGQDTRVLMWDLYNEPGNSNMGDKSLPLLQACFDWARQQRPLQPLTTATWNYAPGFRAFNDTTLDLSDVVTFHLYGDLESTRRLITTLKARNRPIICTEWMARGRFNSRFETHLPLFKQENVGCLSWGLVKGKTQTWLPWDHKPGDPDPAEWHHDVFHPDGRPYIPAEITFIRKFTGKLQTP